MLYTAIRDLINAFVGDQKRFTRPVVVTVSVEENIRVLGFLTCENPASLVEGECVAVYLPQSYNVAGNLLIVPADRVEPLEMDPGDVMKFIVSGGVTSLQARQPLK